MGGAADPHARLTTLATFTGNRIRPVLLRAAEDPEGGLLPTGAAGDRALGRQEGSPPKTGEGTQSGQCMPTKGQGSPEFNSTAFSGHRWGGRTAPLAAVFGGKRRAAPRRV